MALGAFDPFDLLLLVTSFGGLFELDLLAIAFQKDGERAGEVTEFVGAVLVRQLDIQPARGDFGRLADNAVDAADEAAGEQPADDDQDECGAGDDEAGGPDGLRQGPEDCGARNGNDDIPNGAGEGFDRHGDRHALDAILVNHRADGAGRFQQAFPGGGIKAAVLQGLAHGHLVGVTDEGVGRGEKGDIAVTQRPLGGEIGSGLVEIDVGADIADRLAVFHDRHGNGGHQDVLAVDRIDVRFKQDGFAGLDGQLIIVARTGFVVVNEDVRLDGPTGAVDVGHETPRLIVRGFADEVCILAVEGIGFPTRGETDGTRKALERLRQDGHDHVAVSNPLFAKGGDGIVEASHHFMGDTQGLIDFGRSFGRCSLHLVDAGAANGAVAQAHQRGCDAYRGDNTQADGREDVPAGGGFE